MLAAGCARTAPLRAPGPLPATADLTTTDAAIRRALGTRGWVIQQAQLGAIEAIYAPRKHKIWVRITYDLQVVQIHFLGSEGMEESREAGLVYIHARAILWLKNLEIDLARALQEVPHPEQPPVNELPPLPPPPGTVAPPPSGP
jgi:hypothetical protein